MILLLISYDTTRHCAENPRAFSYFLIVVSDTLFTMNNFELTNIVSYQGTGGIIRFIHKPAGAGYSQKIPINVTMSLRRLSFLPR